MSASYMLEQHKLKSIAFSLGLVFGLSLMGASAADAGGRLLATGGATQIEGSAGGGIVPWALISGYGTEDEIGGTAFVTRVGVLDYNLTAFGAAIGINDRIEFSVARQQLQIGSQVLGVATTVDQDILGVKAKIAGDAIFAQDSLMPQISVGMQYKENKDYNFVPKAIGAKRSSGVDFYVSATKLFLGGLAGHNVLLNGTVRATKANQMGLLGFGGDKNDDYQAVFEGSAGVFLDSANRILVGYEYRQKPDNLSSFKEDAYQDIFVAYIPNKRVALVAAYADLGSLPGSPAISGGSTHGDNKKGFYVSAQLSF